MKNSIKNLFFKFTLLTENRGNRGPAVIPVNIVGFFRNFDFFGKWRQL